METNLFSLKTVAVAPRPTDLRFRVDRNEKLSQEAEDHGRGKGQGLVRSGQRGDR